MTASPKLSAPIGRRISKFALLDAWSVSFLNFQDIPFNGNKEIDKVHCFSGKVPFNPLTPNDLYMSRTAPLTSKHCISYIYSTKISTEYFKHALYSPFFSLHNAVCFIMLTCLVPVLFTFYIQDVLKLKT